MSLPDLLLGQAAGYIVGDLSSLTARGLRFGTVYADPPWRFTRKPRDAAEPHYRTMSLDEIAALPVRDLAAADAHLHL